MKKIIAIAALTACSASALAQEPTCSNQRDCEVMWSDAQKAVGLVSNMRIRLLTETRIETFAPTTAGRVGAVVSKVPFGERGYKAVIQLECYRSIDCRDINATGTRLFNDLVAPVPNGRTPAKQATIHGWPAPPAHLSNGADPAPNNQTHQSSEIKSQEQGRDTAQAEKAAIAHACTSQPQAKLAAKGPGFETYSIGCTNGDTMMIRCEYGNCRALR